MTALEPAIELTIKDGDPLVSGYGSIYTLPLYHL